MANFKVTSSNIGNIINDMANDTGTARADEFYFIINEFPQNTIRQMAWDRNMMITIISVDDFTAKFTFNQILS
jgi:hypothetical protein